MANKNLSKAKTIQSKKNKPAKPAIKKQLKAVSQTKKSLPTNSKKVNVIKKNVAQKQPIQKKIEPKKKNLVTTIKKSKPELKQVEKKTLINQKKISKPNVTQKNEKVISRTIPTKPTIVNKAEKPLILPKIKAKNAINYDPTYSHSILDKKETPYKTQIKYSDVDLKIFKQIILTKLEASKSELSYLQGVLSKKDNDANLDSDSKNYSMEEGGTSLEKEQHTQMARRQMQFIDHLEKALIRIENKTYGICSVTGKLIDRDRLKAVPHARLSLEAKIANQN